jgi:hypothetical protein
MFGLHKTGGISWLDERILIQLLREYYFLRKDSDQGSYFLGPLGIHIM